MKKENTIKTWETLKREIKEFIEKDKKDTFDRTLNGMFYLEITNNVFWTLRKYNEIKGCDFEVPTMDFVTNIAIELKKEFPNLKIGTRNYWKGGFEIL